MKKSILSAVLTLTCMGATAQDDISLATRQQQFALDIFQNVVENAEDPNVCFSPLSATMALSMVQNGADGNTLEEMQTTLRTHGLSCEEVNLYNQQLTQRLTSPPPFIYNPDDGLTEDQAFNKHQWLHPVCEIANAMWTKEGFSCYDSFNETLRTYYDAGIGSVDFTTQEGIDEINGWVDENTHGLIPQIYDEPQDPMLMVVLANLLYLKAGWTHPFQSENTKPGTFHQADGSDAKVDMLHIAETFQTGGNRNFNTIRLPYGDERFTMTIFLPAESATLPALTYDDWKDAVGPNTKYKEVHVQLPRFSIEGKYELKDILVAMGMHDAFDGNADFTRMSDEGLYISRVFQSTKIGVDEKGTEAAAVTVVEMRKTTTTMADSDFIVDRPFYFTIEAYDAILFAGCVNQLGPESTHPAFLGDVNGDGNITVTDVTMMVAHTLGHQDKDFIAANADINKDGSITITDITETVSIIMGKN